METNEAIKTLKDHKICFEHDFGWNKQVLEALDAAIEALSANVVEVVRCGDCKRYGGRPWENDRTGICARTDIGVMRDDFCSYGVRKDGDGE